jgi:hypothetical protein
MIVDIVHALMGKGPSGDSDELAYDDNFVTHIASVDCFREACVFVKGAAKQALK